MKDTHDLSLTLVMFRMVNGRIHVFLPGGTLPHTCPEGEKTLDDQAKELIAASGFSHDSGYVEQLYTFSYPESGKVTVTVSYFLLVCNKKERKQRGENAWVDPSEKPVRQREKTIIAYALKRLRWKIEYTNVVYSLMPDEFTLSELQQTYQAILGKKLDKRNFRKKILSLEILKKAGRKRSGTPTRPAMLFSFTKRSPVHVKVFG